MAMQINPEFKSMFREYDIRGRVSENELSDENVYQIVKAYARYIKERGINRAVVGYDNRKCSVGFANAAIKALTEMGVEVIFIGLCITPTVYYAQYLYECEGAVMITASHNPDGWSGFKLGKGYSKTLEPDDIKIVYDYTVNPNSENAEVKGTVTTATDTWSNYIDAIVSRIKMGPKKLKVVLDAGNGSAGLFAYEVFQRLGCTTFQLNCDPDMDYPHYFPNPSDISTRKAIRSLVLHPYIQADAGLMFDGDGDRLGVVDERGRDIWADTILAVLSKQLLERKPNSTIVYDVKCSKTLQDVIAQYKGNGIMWKTGHSYIKSKMQELGAELAGERSGHIFFGGDDYFGFDDGLFVGAKLVEYLSHTEESLSEIIDSFPQYVTSPEIKAHCGDTVKYGVIDAIVAIMKERFPGKVIDINGARVQFEHGWGLVRASSNLPEIVLIFEADTMEQLLEIRSVFKEVTDQFSEVSKKWENDVV